MQKESMMKAPHFVFLSGLSGSGKGYFFDNIMPAGIFHKFVQMTTRARRPNEVDGKDYWFVDEKTFEQEPRATTLWVNERFWQPGEPKWLYGVPASEFERHRGENLAYDVIEPKYIRQMMNWTESHGLRYQFRILHFLPPKENFETAAARANMTNDMKVRHTNTCDLADFWRAGLTPDFTLMSSADEVFLPCRMIRYFDSLFRWRERCRIPQGAHKKRIGDELFLVKSR